MYKVSTDAEKVLLSPSRTLRPYGNVGDYLLNDLNIIDFAIEKVLSTNGLPGIGGAIASKLELTLVKEAEAPLMSNKPINMGVEVLVNDIYERIPLGTFLPSIDSIKKTEQTLKVECFDRMTSFEKVNYTSRLTYPAYIKDMCVELQEVFGVPIANVEAIPTDAKYLSTPVLSIRSVLGEIAELLGANAVINRFDEVEFVTLASTPALTITADNYIDLIFSSDDGVKLSKLSVTGKLLADKLTVPVSKKGEEIDGVELTFTNDSIETEEDLQRIYDVFMPITYMPYEMKLQGLPHVDVGDKITVIDKNDKKNEIIVVTHKLQFNGGLTSEWSSEAPDGLIVETGSTGSTAITDKIDSIQDNSESVVYFENRKTINIRNTLSEVAKLAIALTGNTEAIMHFTALVESSGNATLFFELDNNNFLYPFKPAQTVIPGLNMVNFTLPLMNLDTSTNNILSIKVKSDSDVQVLSIGQKNAQIIVRGRNILDGASKLPFTGGAVDEVISVEAVRDAVQIAISVDTKIVIANPFEIRASIKEIMKIQPTLAI